MKKFLSLLAIICLAVFVSACVEPDDTPTPTKVSVTLDLDGGEIDGSLSHFAEIGKNLVINQPTKYGFDFVGWSYNGEIISLSPFNVNDYAVNLKAVWTVKPCTITCELDGGSFPDGKPLVYVVNVGENANIPTPIKVGYKFEGWYYNSGKIELNPFNIPDVFNMKLKAKWSVKSYLVNFDFNGGKLIENGQELTSYTRVQTFSQDVDFPKPQKTGYVFKGYKLDGNLFDSQDWNVDQDGVTLVAYWEPISIRYAFEVGGGQLSVEGGFINYGDSTQTIKNTTPIKRGYTFGGWTVNGQPLVDVWEYLPTLNSSVSIVALWSPNSYNVTLNAGEGSLSGSDTATLAYGAEDTLPVPTPIVGKNFLGWKIESLDKIITTHTGKVIYNYDYSGELIAVYVDKQYLIFINIDGSIETVEITFNEEDVENSLIDVPLPKQPVGYEVVWEFSDDEIRGFTETTEIKAIISREKTYVACFKNGDTELFSCIYRYGSVVTLPNEDYLYKGEYKARKKGYRLLGWSLTPNDTEYIGEIEWKFTSPTTYFYAVYTPIVYDITYDYSSIAVQCTLLNGDKLANDTQAIVYGSQYSLYTLIVTDDLAVVSWSYKGKMVPNSGIWNIDENAVLIATVEEGKSVPIDVNVDLNGGSGKPFGTIVLGQKFRTMSEIPTPPKGYELVGFKYRDKIYTLDDVWDVLDYDGIPLVVQYEKLAEEVVVNLDLNGGSGSLKAKIKIGSQLTTMLPKPTAQNGYKLTGFIYNGKFYALIDVWDVLDYDGSVLIAQYEEDSADWGPEIPVNN